MTYSCQYRFFFEILTQGFDTIFYYTFQEGSKLNLLNIHIIQIKYGISIKQTDNIMKNIVQECWGKNTKYEVQFQQSPFPVDKYFENALFMDTHIIGEYLKKITWRITQSLGWCNHAHHCTNLL